MVDMIGFKVATHTVCPIPSANAQIRHCAPAIYDIGGWGDEHEILRLVGLLRDVETRWSSLFFMIDRVLELNLAGDGLLSFPQSSNYHS